MKTRRVLVLLSKVFFGIAVAAGVAMIVLTLLGSTVYGARTGCEECSPHIDVVILSILAVGGALLSTLIAFVLTVVAHAIKPGVAGSE